MHYNSSIESKFFTPLSSPPIDMGLRTGFSVVHGSGGGAGAGKNSRYEERKSPYPAQFGPDP